MLYLMLCIDIVAYSSYIMSLPLQSATVEYRDVLSAGQAISSPDAVLGNRFIRVCIPYSLN